MVDALHHLSYVHVMVVALIGFVFGSLWYTVLFGKAWAAEMKINPEAEKPSMAPMMIKGYLCTLVSTWGLALLLAAHGTTHALNGAAFGVAVGLLIVGARHLNHGVWDGSSCKLQSINLGHEVLLFAIQGAILGVWR